MANKTFDGISEEEILEKESQEAETNVNDESANQTSNEKDDLADEKNICEDSEEIKKLKEDYENLNNKFLRLQADFYNYKTRTEKERISTYGNAVADVLTDLLPIIDNFERAIESENSDNSEVVSFKSGVSMIYDQLMNTLQKKGLKEIEALDAKFDPNYHAGIGFEVVEDKEEDTIIEVFQKGYTVNEKVIRPSMVKIAKN